MATYWWTYVEPVERIKIKFGISQFYIIELNK